MEAGRTTMADVLRVQMEIKEKSAQLEFYRDQEKNLETHFNALLNRLPDAEIVVQDSINILPVQIDYQALMDSVLANNPEMQGLHKQQEALDSKVEVAKKSAMPSFGLGLNYAVINPRTDIETAIPKNGQDMLMPTATISIPLYRKKYKALIKEAEFQQKGISDNIENTRNSLRTELIGAINQYRDADRKVVLYNELLVQARQTLNILMQSYTGGQTGYEEVLRVERQLLQYQLELEKAKADFDVSIALVEKNWVKNF